MCDVTQILYDEGENIFIDELGYMIPNVHTYIDPNMVYLFKTKKEDMFCYGIHGGCIELIYLPFGI